MVQHKEILRRVFDISFRSFERFTCALVAGSCWTRRTQSAAQHSCIDMQDLKRLRLEQPSSSSLKKQKVFNGDGDAATAPADGGQLEDHVMESDAASTHQYQLQQEEEEEETDQPSLEVRYISFFPACIFFSPGFVEARLVVEDHLSRTQSSAQSDTRDDVYVLSTACTIVNGLQQLLTAPSSVFSASCFPLVHALCPLSQSFRKEAIWREMQEYKRKFLRASSEVEQLQVERARCEARLSAVDISWNLVSSAQMLRLSCLRTRDH